MKPTKKNYRLMTKLFAGLAFLVLSVFPAGSPAAEQTDQVPVQILAINDFHGHMAPGPPCMAGRWGAPRCWRRI